MIHTCPAMYTSHSTITHTSPTHHIHTLVTPPTLTSLHTIAPPSPHPHPHCPTSTPLTEAFLLCSNGFTLLKSSLWSGSITNGFRFFFFFFFFPSLPSLPSESSSDSSSEPEEE